MAIWNFNSITQSCFLCLVILFSSRIQANPPAATKGGASICFKALQIIQDYSKLSDVQNTEIAFRNSLDITSTHGVEVAHKQVMTTLFLWLKEKKGFNSLTFSELLVDGKFRLPNGTQLKTVGVPLSNDSPIPEFWAFRLEHPDNQIEGRRWIVEVGVSRVQQKVTMQTNVRYFQAIPQLGFAPPSPSLGPPKFIKDLLQTDKSLAVTVGGFDVKNTHSFGIAHVDQLNRFLSLLTNPNRRTPVFLVSISHGEYAIDHDALADRLWGIGPVFYETPEFSLMQGFVDQKVPQALSVHSGAIRIYLPGFDVNDPFNKHPIISLPTVDRNIQLGNEQGFIEHLAKQVQVYVDQTPFIYSTGGTEYLRAQLSLEWIKEKLATARPATLTDSNQTRPVPASPIQALKNTEVPKKTLPQLEGAPASIKNSGATRSLREGLEKVREAQQAVEVTRLKNENTQLKDKIDELQSQIKDLNERLIISTEEGQVYQSIAQETGGRNVELTQKQKGLESALEELRSENLNLRAQVDSLNDAFQSLEPKNGDGKLSRKGEFKSQLLEKFADLLYIDPSASFEVRKRLFIQEFETIGHRFSQEDLLARFAEVFSDRVLILDSAKESNKAHLMDTAYLVEMLVAVAEHGWEAKFQKNLNGRSFENFMNQNAGYKYTNNETQQTMDKYGDERRFQLPIVSKDGFKGGRPAGKSAGRVVTFEGHLKNGNNRKNNKIIRIYFGFDEEFPEKVIFGHIGDHLNSISNDNY